LAVAKHHIVGHVDVFHRISRCIGTCCEFNVDEIKQRILRQYRRSNGKRHTHNQQRKKESSHTIKVCKLNKKRQCTAFHLCFSRLAISLLPQTPLHRVVSTGPHHTP